MSTPPTPQPEKPAPSAAARYLVVFVIGLFVGLIFVVMSLRALESRKTWQDRYPLALMHLYQAQLAQLSGNLESNRCAPTDNLAHLQTMRALSGNLEAAFPDLREHRGFVAHAGEVRRVLDAALAAPPMACPGLKATIGQIGDACQACHQDMRG